MPNTSPFAKVAANASCVAAHSMYSAFSSGTPNQFGNFSISALQVALFCIGSLISVTLHIETSGSGDSAVGVRNCLKQVAIQVSKIQSSTTVVVVYFSRQNPTWIRPIVEPLFADAFKRLVEVILTHQKRVMLGGNFRFDFMEVERYAVAKFDHQKRAKLIGLR